VYRKKFIERQLTMIQSRPGAPTNFLLGDVGHEFGTYRVEYNQTPNTLRDQAAGGDYRDFVNVVPGYHPYLDGSGTVRMSDGYLDPFGGYFRSKGFPFTTPLYTFGPSEVSLRAIASNHISEMNPFGSKASVLSTLLELARGDIPGLLTSLRRHFTLIQGMKAAGVRDAASALGSEYLNNVFGWSPIIRDVDKSIKILLALDQMLFPEDDTRRTVRRVVSLRGGIIDNHAFQCYAGSPLAGIVTTNPGPPYRMTSASGAYGYASAPYPNGTFNGSASVLEELSVWTTARFATAARPSATNNSHLDRAIDLLGLELTPEVLWELTPWSWLIDWFSNMGTVIGNLSTLGLSNTILNYAYSTARIKSSSSVSGRPVIVPSGAGIRSFTGHVISSRTIDAKVRLAASPFGFDVTLGSLNAGQWAILTALGLARSR
jgi:hypothetical protein